MALARLVLGIPNEAGIARDLWGSSAQKPLSPFRSTFSSISSTATKVSGLVECTPSTAIWDRKEELRFFL